MGHGDAAGRSPGPLSERPTLALKCPPRAGPSLAAKKRRPQPTAKAAQAEIPAEPVEFEDVAARAARLGIAPERVLREYAHIAFADLRDIVRWDDDGVKLKSADEVGDDAALSISEIAAGGSSSGKVHVKLYNKKAALDAIARHLGMFPPPRRHDDDAPVEPTESAREVFARHLARLVAERVEGAADYPIELEGPGDREP